MFLYQALLLQKLVSTLMNLVNPIKNYDFNLFALNVATAAVSVDTISFVYIFASFISSVFTLNVATATVSVGTMEFGQPNEKNHHLNMFALSIATATGSVNTIHFCVHINNYNFLRVYTKRCYCNR